MDYQGYDKDFTPAGKVALITGGAAGIGRAIATLYALKRLPAWSWLISVRVFDDAGKVICPIPPESG